jgi:uncharacterized protein
MIINLKQLFNITGESKQLDCSVEKDELSHIHGCCFVSPVAVKGKIYNRAGIVHLDYTVDFTLLVTCDRCLKELERDYHFEFSHIVVQSLNSDNDDYIVADGESIDMSEIAVTDLLLQLPTKYLCKEDCKGLCMVCGCDLNESECDCLK